MHPIRRLRQKASAYFDSDIISSKEVLDIYLPLAGEQLFFAFVALLGTWMITGEGEAAISAVTMINVCNLMFSQVCIALGTGGTVVVAQYIGARSPRMAARTLQQSMSAALVVSLLITAGLLLMRRSIVDFFLVGAPGEVLDLALVYFAGVSLSLPFYAVFQGFAGAMRGWGRTKVALRLTVTVNCLEIAFSALLVLALRWGVVGLATAIIASRAIGSIVSIIYVVRNRTDMHIAVRDFFRPMWPILRGLMIVSVPVALEQVFFNSGKAFTQRYIASYGTTHMVANAASTIVYNLGIAPNTAIMTATLAIVGRCIGHERIDLARDYTRKFVRASSLFCLFIIAPIIPFTALIIYLYGVTPESAALTYLTVGIFFAGAPLFVARSSITPSALRAGGDAVFTSAFSLCSMWLVRVWVAYIFTRILPWGVVGVVCAMVLEWGVRGFFFSGRFKTDKWYRHKLIVRE